MARNLTFHFLNIEELKKGEKKRIYGKRRGEGREEGWEPNAFVSLLKLRGKREAVENSRWERGREKGRITLISFPFTLPSKWRNREKHPTSEVKGDRKKKKIKEKFWILITPSPSFFPLRRKGTQGARGRERGGGMPL